MAKNEPFTKSPATVAESMLKRYSSPKIALEMAQLHSQDYIGEGWEKSLDWWRSVAKEIRRIAKLKSDGSPEA